MSQAFLDLHPNAEISLVETGLEKQPFLQVDSFMRDANILRKYAIDKSAFAVADTFYPGVRMDIPTNYTHALVSSLKDSIESGFGFSMDKLKTMFSSYSIVSFSPSELNIGQRIPHFDSLSRTSLAFVHYLCDFPDSGTSLYRHKSTGYEYVDETRVEHMSGHLRDQFGDVNAYPEGYITDTTDVFEKIHSGTAKFNRLVAYRGCSLHSGNIKPGTVLSTDPAVGRLTVTTLLEFG